MSNIRTELQKVAFNPNIFNPIVGAITKKIVRSGIRESILGAAEEKHIMQAPDQQPDTTALAPSPVVYSSQPGSPTVVRLVPVIVNNTQEGNK